MIAHPETTLDLAMERLAQEDFFVPAHQELFQLLRDMHLRHQPIDVVTVHQNLLDRGRAQALGSPAILAELCSSFPTHLNVSSYIQIVKDKSLLRRLHEACSRIADSILSEPQPVAHVLDQAEEAIFRVTGMALTQNIVPGAKEIARAIQLVDAFRKRKGHLFGIPTGFYQLDQLTTGWQKGDMIVLAARPGVGKTALALTFARHALSERYDPQQDAWVKPGHAVGLFSLEMTNAQLMLRLLASVASESLQRIRRGEVDDFQMQKLAQIAEDIKTWPLYLDDSSDLTIHQLRAKARRMKQQYGIELLIIDYLQLLHSDSPQARENRQVEIAEISRGIKALAKELNLPIIVLAQLNRRPDEGRCEPALHHLRESGAIEQDADVVLLLHRLDSDAEEESDSSPSSQLIPYSLHIAKQRNGPTEKMEIRFNPAYTRFEDPLRHPTR